VQQGAVVVVAGKSVRVSAKVLAMLQEVIDVASDIDKIVVGEARLKFAPTKVSIYLTTGRKPRAVEARPI